MSEYELADLVRSISADSLVFLPMLLSVVSGYLVVAWVVGARLTLAQVSLVNTLFLSVVTMFCFGWVNRVQLALVYQSELLDLNPARHELIGPWLVPATLAYVSITAIACIKFMWDIRHHPAR